MADENVIIPVPLNTYRYMVQVMASAIHPNHSYSDVNQLVQSLARMLPENQAKEEAPSS